MKCLKRNERTFYYALPTGRENVTKNGYLTGDVAVSYGPVESVHGNIAPPTGKVFVELFGTSLLYDRVIVMDDPETPICEGTVLCVDVPPSYDASNNLIYDYIVRKVARSLNSVSIAVSKVNIR